MSEKFNWENIKKLTEYINDGLQIFDKDGVLVFCNRKSAILDNISIEEALGKHITEIYPSLNEDNSTLLRVLKTGQPMLDIEQIYTTYLGNEVNTVNSTIPLFNAKNEIVAAAEISKNITQVKKLSERVVNLQNAVLKVEESFVDDTPLFKFEDIITQDKETMKIIFKGMKVAVTDAPVLVVGETGTGKELLVQSIHNSSSRREKPFIVQNCASLPESLLEGILFGTMKGGFTGSVNRPGLFEIANGGTLFLDEINSMPQQLQTKLLRVLQDGRFRRIGDTKTREANVRLIAAINEDPFVAIEKGDLRRDLFYRLNTVTLSLSKLSERTGDIEVLTKYFVKKFNKKYFKNITGISNKVNEIFENFIWPGNIRELEHVIEGAISIMDGEIITVEHIPDYLKKRQKNINLKKYDIRENIEKLEKELIESVLEQVGGNISKAAKILNIPRQTLQYKIKKIRA